ncbi:MULTISPECIES: 4-hydroxy-tetrahydrodipicolinate synthase [Providencia]|uniref:4-hydroxy-tetrahydrodipicolinate synthase n=1 Tax=Providencia TaxID=586 RepID=UPI0015EBD0B0|nr:MULTISPECIES: 4-hydroxy-tetrahydrodipicolinate synthase [Providencia]EJD6041522.1 4-hydroxy-tetrahydrodipicolinate synthase [Providencia rettgeri]EJD6537844.1 4-hydroxy-tetrahydrodipicolinate synthase [Providencia rettgeri]ELQ1456170.1 4-hydroxy-tetrahydrodipicolinate synthase [Providencia rettgeri]ELQ1459025.1 4-hydroxy-tetrahydrodipicolinate synthase [Providencia rettgeri]ELR5124093.1 4-hydroxy-tetrahydrodipicolinate synthase [Providencia rettgeri]
MNFHGILVPLVTPFHDDLSLNISGLAELTEQLIAKGVTGLVVCGTTGEYYALNEDERQTVLSTVSKIAKGRVTLIAGINDLSTEGAIARAEQAKNLGYEGLMLSPPPYSLPDQQGVYAHYEKVAKSTSLPIIMYNFPARIGIEIEIDTVMKLAEIDNIVAIKESSGSFSRALHLLQTSFKNFEVICGCDDQPVDFFFWGSKSWIAGAGNVFPSEQVAIYEAAQLGDWDKAKQIMKTIYPAIYSMESGDYNQKAKAGCLNGSFNAGPVRLPLSNLATAARNEFIKLVKS